MTETQNTAWNLTAQVGTGKSVHLARVSEDMTPDTRCGAEWRNGRFTRVRLVAGEVNCRSCLRMPVK